MKRIFAIIWTVLLLGCNSNAQTKEKQKAYPVTKTEPEWKAQLSNLQYHVLREAGTERAWTSKFNSLKEEGTYVCAGCDTPLFESKHKYDSGSGWPSFDREIEGNVDYSIDYNIGMARKEEHCANCGGHLGHVFNDGPRETTGLRHCINGAALKFVPKKKD